MSAISFDYDAPKRSDFVLIKTAIKRGYSIPREIRESLMGICMKARQDNRTDRIAVLAQETLDLLAASIEQTAKAG